MMDETSIAMGFLRGAFRTINRQMTRAEEVIFAIRIKDAIREGLTNGKDIAMRALELEGFRPKWVTAGEISYDGIDNRN